MKQIIKKDKLIITGTFKETISQIKLLALKYDTLKAFLDDYNKD